MAKKVVPAEDRRLIIQLAAEHWRLRALHAEKMVQVSVLLAEAEDLQIEYTACGRKAVCEKFDVSHNYLGNIYYKARHPDYKHLIT